MAGPTSLLPPVVGEVFFLTTAFYRTRLPSISNNVGPVKLFLKTLLSFHLKEFFSFVLFRFLFFCIDDYGSFVI
jgi:hypothetical protein